MSDHVAEEIAMFSEVVNGFADAEIEPHYQQWERDGIFPRELWNKLGEAGFLCTDIPEAFGGAGADLRISAVILRELSRRGFNSIAVSLSVHSDIVAHYLLNRGSDEQKERYLPGMISGEFVGAIAMTDPGAGSVTDRFGQVQAAVSLKKRHAENGAVGGDQRQKDTESAKQDRTRLSDKHFHELHRARYHGDESDQPQVRRVERHQH